MSSLNDIVRLTARTCRVSAIILHEVHISEWKGSATEVFSLPNQGLSQRRTASQTNSRLFPCQIPRSLLAASHQPTDLGQGVLDPSGPIFLRVSLGVVVAADPCILQNLQPFRVAPLQLLHQGGVLLSEPSEMPNHTWPPRLCAMRRVSSVALGCVMLFFANFTTLFSTCFSLLQVVLYCRKRMAWTVLWRSCIVNQFRSLHVVSSCFSFCVWLKNELAVSLFGSSFALFPVDFGRFLRVSRFFRSGLRLFWCIWSSFKLVKSFSLFQIALQCFI